jgi:hypothetical protein
MILTGAAVLTVLLTRLLRSIAPVTGDFFAQYGTLTLVRSHSLACFDSWPWRLE